MSNVLFISETALKESSVINENVDNKKITPLIKECQDMYILPILGTGLFNELVAEITLNDTVPGSISSLNQILLNSYIQPCLIAYIKYEAPIELTYNFTNKAVSKKTSENSSPISLDEISRLMDMYKNKAQWRAERITNYLKENRTSYPLFDQPGTGYDVIRPNRGNYRTGMILDDDCCTDYDCHCNGKC